MVIDCVGVYFVHKQTTTGKHVSVNASAGFTIDFSFFNRISFWWTKLFFYADFSS